jgi:serine/threonine-protein kinase
MTRPDSSTRIGPVPAPPLPAGGYAPGTILAERYRMVALLGRGGMGEVYRADDLKLGQPVALKFLPERLEHDADARARLLAEARSARGIAHPNVCRVYDVGDVDARPFLTMEYIDGEDLASLLRRIGRLPSAKAIEIARQLCSGLAAAHERGVLHRDLKPANVMIDGRGQARITDFGLAVEKLAGADAGDFAGTVAYMAPERLHGAPATVQSDIYALGLILYEVCTGTPPFRAETFEAWREAHDSSAPTPPAELSGDIDPALERVILRCLEKDPARRPASVTRVAAALPGGDPLAAAIAAGETPSPELVAASGEEGTLPRRTAWLLLGACVLVLAAFAVVWQWIALPDIVPFVGGPEVLQARARAVLASLGYPSAPRDSAWVIDVDPNQRRALASRDSTARRFADTAQIRPTLLRFRYRQSPADLRPLDALGFVTPSDPAPAVSGDTLLDLDTLGHLTFLNVMPPLREPEAGLTEHAADWRPLLTAAGLSDVHVTPATPVGVPPVAFDERQAWVGTLGGHAFRFEAAAFRGRIVFARWGDPPDDADLSRAASTALGAIAAAVVAILWILLLLLVILLARSNVKLGRGDRRGARRVALFVLALALAADLASRHWVPDVEWVWTVISTKLGWSLYRAAFVWLAYLALEPLARRAWPHLLIGWSRLIDGRWRDPLVGQALVAGVLYGAVSSAAAALPETAGRLFNLAGTEPFLAPWALAPAAVYLSEVGVVFTSGALYALAVVAIMVIVRVALRAEQAVFAATALAVALFSASGVRPLAFDLVSAAIIGVGSVWFLRRFGLLALAAGITVSYLLRSAPWTFDLAKWFAWRPMLSVILIGGLALWGFRNVLGRQSVFPKLQLD